MIIILVFSVLQDSYRGVHLFVRRRLRCFVFPTAKISHQFVKITGLEEVASEKMVNDPPRPSHFTMVSFIASIGRIIKKEELRWYEGVFYGRRREKGNFCFFITGFQWGGGSQAEVEIGARRVIKGLRNEELIVTTAKRRAMNYVPVRGDVPREWFRS